MAVSFGHVAAWVEDHPVEAAVIGGGSVLVLLWLFGVFGHGSSGASAGASNLASAYYAAEAQQAVVGGQIQQANIAANMNTAIATTQANASVAINAANAHASTIINGQNTGAATTINADQVAGANYQTAQQYGSANYIAGLGANVAVAQSSDQLQATLSNNQTAAYEVASNNQTAATINAANNQASLWQTIFGQIVPYDQTHNQGGAVVQFGGQTFGVGTDTSTPAYMSGVGYTPAQISSALAQRGIL